MSLDINISVEVNDEYFVDVLCNFIDDSMNKFLNDLTDYDYNLEVVND